MKKFKKLIPAFAMLLVSVIMLGSSTYAWFSMNNKVTASGMQVTAQANTQYLVISNSTDFTGNSKEFTFENPTAGGIMNGETNSKKVYPCKFLTEGATVGGYTVPDNSFYTANSNLSDKVGTENDAQVINGKAVTAGSTDYMFTYEIYVGLAAGSSDYTGDITVKATVIGNAGAAVIKLGDNGTLQELTTAEEGFKFTNVTIEDGNPLKFVVYLYIDGTHESVKSSNGEAITGNLALEFTADGIGA